ncbi:MAG TPA: D-alanyl-D-alanine carboxypeptidase/D-alanyl-D-alanine-endopeptidase [Bryobacteraceae bacterium]|nr:D-alanyl-D-alanine carboxypeptidase/D-alanyl-D-alanine-endopeptidase [Bryobacteraceae bacterium]
MRMLVAMLVGAGLCSAQSIEPRPIDTRIEELLKQYPAVARGAWGAYAVNLGSGEILYQRDSSHTFVPASNNKLYATALALSRLGPDHHLVTRVVTLRKPSPQGLLAGDLVLQGGGDPTLSGREWPYRKNGAWSDPLGPLDELATQVWESGVRRISGDIIGDDRAYFHEPFPPGWSEDDTLYDYGAPVSALVLHDNYLTIRVEAGQPGELAHLRSTPETGYFQVINRVVSTAKGPSRVGQRRSGDGRVIELWGTVSASSPVSLDVALDDPARYAAHAFRYLLTRRGIIVDGDACPRHRDSAEAPVNGDEENVELARRTSPPLAQIIQVTNKVSQNLYAELLLRELARVRGKAGARRAALDEMGGWLRSLGARSDDFAFFDGSGLSRLALVSPEATIRVLKAMYEGPHRDIWLDSLPLGGEDGSLSLRFKGWTDGRVRAKTGTLTHVTSLSGYLDTQSGDIIAFSVMANNANTNATGIRGFIDALVMALAGPSPTIPGAQSANPQ